MRSERPLEASVSPVYGLQKAQTSGELRASSFGQHTMNIGAANGVVPPSIPLALSLVGRITGLDVTFSRTTGFSISYAKVAGRVVHHSFYWGMFFAIPQ